MTRAREIADLAGLVNADSASIAWDTSTLYIDAINNRIGIGTTTPAISLDISSNTDALHIPSGTTQQRPSGSNGMFRYNTTDAQFEGYADGAWGAIAGSGGGSSAMQTNHFTGNDSATAFTLGSSVSSEDDLIVFIEGIYQNKADYIASGTTLTLDVAPASGRKIVAHHIRAGISGSNLVQNSFSGNGSTTDFTLSLNPVSENNTQVFIDGLYQQKNAYSTSGTTLSFSEAPPNGSTIEVMLFTQTDINTATIVQDADKDTKIQVEESSDEDIIRFDTAGTERMVINSSGNVGIGTSSPDVFSRGYSGTTVGISSASGESAFMINSSGTNVAALEIGRAGARETLIYDTSTTTQIGSVTSKPVLFTTGGTERLRIDSSGNLLVGKTSADDTTAGVRVNGPFGFISAVRDGNLPLLLNRLTSDGTIVDFRKDGTSVGSIGTQGGRLTIGDGDTGLRFADDFDNIQPFNVSTNAIRDNAIDLGSTAGRFDDIFATNGTIQTSDRNEKQDEADLSDAETRVAVVAKGLLKKFRWKSAVEEKGDEARVHFGIIAQDLQDAFTAEGLDASDYAMFISSTWTDEETGEERTRLGVRYSELLAFIIAGI